MTGDHDTITLRDAADHFGFTVAALRAEADCGRLPIYKIGKRLYTKRTHVAELNQCVYGRKNVEPIGSGIYVIGFEHYVKIGWSENLPRRLNALRISLPETIKIHATFSCRKTNERILHRRFRQYRTRGEWFRSEGDIADWITRGCPL